MLTQLLLAPSVLEEFEEPGRKSHNLSLFLQYWRSWRSQGGSHRTSPCSFSTGGARGGNHKTFFCSFITGGSGGAVEEVTQPLPVPLVLEELEEPGRKSNHLSQLFQYWRSWRSRGGRQTTSPCSFSTGGSGGAVEEVTQPLPTPLVLEELEEPGRKSQTHSLLLQYWRSWRSQGGNHTTSPYSFSTGRARGAVEEVTQPLPVPSALHCRSWRSRGGKHTISRIYHTTSLRSSRSR